MLSNQQLRQLNTNQLRKLVRKQTTLTNKLIEKRTKQLGSLAEFAKELRQDRYTPPTNQVDRVRLIGQYQELNQIREQIQDVVELRANAAANRKSFMSWFNNAGLKVPKKGIQKAFNSFYRQYYSEVYHELIQDSSISDLLQREKVKEVIPSDEMVELYSMPDDERREKLIKLLDESGVDYKTKTDKFIEKAKEKEITKDDFEKLEEEAYSTLLDEFSDLL